MTALEEQKRFLQVTLADASAIQSAFTQGYALLRKTIDTSVEHLIEPVRQARNQIERIDFELSQKDEK